MQFLTEAAVLTSMGGIIGVGAGVGLAYLISDVASVRLQSAEQRLQSQ